MQTAKVMKEIKCIDYFPHLYYYVFECHEKVTKLIKLLSALCHVTEI